MISFTLLTDTPARLRNFLVNRGVIKLIPGRDGKEVYVGTLPGMEWIEVSNPIVTTPAVGERMLPLRDNPDYIPAVGDPFMPDGVTSNPDYIQPIGESSLPPGPNPDYVPPVHDTRRVFMVKFAHDSAENEVDGETTTIDPETGRAVPVNQYDWSKFGKWVKNNSTLVTAPANYTINGEPVGNAYKINGENVWLVKDKPERFGTWQ